MALIGRRREIAVVRGLLDRAGEGSGGVLVVAGPDGSGRTALANLAADEARRRGFDVYRAAAVAERPGRWAWAQLLRDTGAAERTIAGLLADPEPLDLVAAAAALSGGLRRRAGDRDVVAHWLGALSPARPRCWSHRPCRSAWARNSG
jgi:hypothetical protein